MKKLLSVVCLLAMLVGVFAACEAHEHDFERDWSFDDDYHWHACTAVDGCPETDDMEEHEFEVVMDDEGNPINKCKVCDATNDKVDSAPEHEHTFDEKLTAGDNFHWYACTVEGCYESKDKAEHTFGNPDVTYADNKITIKYVCVDCAFEKVDEQKVKTEVDDALAWDNAFKNFRLTNFTMDVFLVSGDYTHNNHCIVTETAAYYCIPDSKEFYTIPNEDGTYTTYFRRDSDAPFTILADTSTEYLIGAQTETVIQISFEKNFEKFTYDAETASYVCTDTLEANYYSFEGELYGTLYCYNNVVKITDGKISYIEADYHIDSMDEDDKCSFRYYNIGMSAVEVPQDVSKDAVEESDETVTGNTNMGENSNIGEVATEIVEFRTEFAEPPVEIDPSDDMVETVVVVVPAE